MKSEYKHYSVVDKEILDSIKVGDLVKINDWKRPLRVKAVSENFFVMAAPCFGKHLYSVCEKKPFRNLGSDYPKYYCSTDFFSWGHPLTIDYENLYAFDNPKANEEYLLSFETGETELSMRNAVMICDLYVKSN